MTTNTKIEWADHTFNPWWGCTKISPACDHCYAAALDKRTGGDHWGANQPRMRTSAKNWLEPVKWNKQAEAFFAEHGRRQRVFCASMADVFDNEIAPQWRADLFQLIHKTPNIDWLLLTKRVGNAEQMMRDSFGFIEFQPSAYKPLPNVWLGATICNQAEADRDIPKLLAVPAAKRFLSIEPMLGPVNLHLKLTTLAERLRVQHDYQKHPNRFYRYRSIGEMLDWVIVGGESGHGARPMHPDWARSLRDQCAAAGVPFMFKQWGDWLPGCEATCMHEGAHSDGQMSRKIWFLKIDGSLCKAGDIGYLMEKTTKKAAGRLLDGVEHNGTPS